MRGKRNLGPAVLAFRKNYESEAVSAAERQRELDAIAAFPRSERPHWRRSPGRSR